MNAPVGSRLLLDPFPVLQHDAANPAADWSSCTPTAAGPIPAAHRSQADVAREIHARAAPYNTPPDLALAVLRRRLRRIERRAHRAVFVGTSVGGSVPLGAVRVDVDAADGRRARPFFISAAGSVFRGRR